MKKFLYVIIFGALSLAAKAQSSYAEVYYSTVSYGVVHVSLLLHYSNGTTTAMGFYNGSTHTTISGTYTGHIEEGVSEMNRITTYGVLDHRYSATDTQLDALNYDFHQYEFNYNALDANCGSIVSTDLDADLGTSLNGYYQDMAVGATLMDWTTLMSIYMVNPMLGIYIGYSTNWNFFTDVIYYYNYVTYYWDSTVENFYYGAFIIIGWW